MQWHDVTRKILGGPLGGPGKILGGSSPPWHPPSSAPALTCCNIQVKQRYCTMLATATGNCDVTNVTCNENNYYVVT